MKEDIELKRNIVNLKVVENGYDQNLFYYTNQKRVYSKKIINLISVGYLEYVKGHDILLEALNLLEENYHLTIVGDGVLLTKYKGFVEVILNITN